MLQTDPSSKCSIYNKYFFDDLYPYQYNENLDYIEYFTGESTVTASRVDQSKALSIIENVYKNNSKLKNGVWIPVFLSSRESLLENKTLFRSSSAISKNIGIEKAIIFNNPLFMNWNVTNGNMEIDWIITPQLAPFIPTYGLMFWYRNNVLDDQQKEALTGTDAPYDVILNPTESYFDGKVSISPSNKLIRKTSDLYLIIDKDHIKYSPIFLNHAPGNFFSVSEYVKHNKLKKENIKFKRFYKNNLVTKIDDDGRYPSIWIPEGEMYSYIDSEDVAEEEYRLNIASKSYLSPVLSPIYREIYHILTSRLKKRIVNRIPQPSMNINQSRMIKKIAYVLSTMPGMDRTTVSILNEIISDTEKKRGSEDNELFVTLLGSAKEDADAVKVPSIDQEIAKLTQIVTKISEVFGNLLNKTYENESFSNNGLVNTKKDLFNRLSFKYGGKLVLRDQAKLTYMGKLKYGPHIKINQDVMTKCPINLRDTLVFNNVKFEVGKFVAESNISLNNSLFELYHRDRRDQKVTIPLWDIEKTKLFNTKVPFSAGKDIEIQFYDPNIKAKETRPEDSDANVIREIEFDLSDSYVEIGDRLNPSVLGGESPEIEWSRISGPDCLRFSNYFLQTNLGNDNLRYATSNDINPTIYVKKPGRYVLKLTVTSVFGIVSDTIVIHIVDNKTYQRAEPLLPLTERYLSADDNLCVILPSIRECSFGKQGVFWPSYSDCSVREPVARELQENVNNLAQPGGSIPPRVISFGQAHHKFAIPMPVNNKNEKIIQETNAELSITYNCNNTKVELTKIMLTYMMDNNEDCRECESLYDGIPDNAGFMIDAGTNFSFFDMTKDTLMDVPAPNALSTKRADIRSYGGFSESEIKNLGITLPDHPAPGTRLESFELTEDLLNSRKKTDDDVSGQKPIEYICHDTHIPTDSSVKFNKGYFHPFSGWLDTSVHQNFSNKTSVINFRADKSPQKFRGLGFYNLENNFIDSKAVVYRSTITLDVDKAYQVNRDKSGIPKDIIIDLPDQVIHHGYRAGSNVVSLRTLPYVDNCDASFSLESDDAIVSEQYCNGDIQEYKYSCTYTATQASAAGGSIYDLEIKLNYLNYINPKDLVIWLEMDACADVADSLNPAQKEEGGSRPVKEPWEGYRDLYKEFGLIDKKSDKLKKYLYQLWDMNDNDYIDISKVDLDTLFAESNSRQKRSPKFYLYLTNQDHIYGTEFNTAILFTDKLDLYRNFNNNNSLIHFRNNNNHVSLSENGTIYLPPTLSAKDFSDVEINKYKNILLTNGLYNRSHNFFKFNDKDLYEPAPGGEGQQVPPNSSSTSFTLCIAIVNESESMEPYDRLKITDAILGYDSSKIKNKSNLVRNSLCSWDLILHKGENIGTYGRDSLSNIDYYSEEPQYSGYNFIANFNKKLHLIPPVNLNAPNFYTTDGRACQYAKESLNIPSYFTPQALNLTPFIMLMPYTLIGALVTLELFSAHMNNEARQISNYFGSIRRGQQKELFDRAWFVPKYERYAFGSPNKALINVSKDGGTIWYKLEASIFKYDNSLVMEKNSYRFVKLHYKSMLKSLAIFKATKPKTGKSFINIIHGDYIKNIHIPVVIETSSVATDPLSLDSLKKKLKEIQKEIDKLKEQIKNARDNDRKKELDKELAKLLEKQSNITKTISSAGEGIEDGDLINLLNQDIKSENGYYICQKTYEENGKILINFVSIKSYRDIFVSEKLSQYNNIYDLSMTVDTDNRETGIDIDDGVKNEQIVILDGVRPYHFFTATEHKNIITFELKTGEKLTKEDEKKISDLEKKLKEEIKKDKPSNDIILNIENEIWDIRYIKHKNEIIGQGYSYSFKNGKYKTILILKEKMIGTQISIEPDASQRVIIYKDDFISKIDEEDLPFNIWSNLQNTAVSIKSPLNQHSSWAPGNYGFGSNLTKNSFITEQFIESQLTPFTDIADVQKNSKNRIGSFKIVDDSNQIINGIINSLGYKYNLNNLIDNEPQIYNNQDTIINLLSKEDQEVVKNSFKDLRKNIFTKQINLHDFIEINILTNTEEQTSAVNYGNIYFNKDIKQNIIYGLSNASVELLDNRIKTIDSEIKKTLKNIEDLSKANAKESAEEKDKKIKQYNDDIVTYVKEKRSIAFYKEKVSKTITEIPHISVDVKTSANGSISFVENHKNDYYWIDIDADQSCSVDKDRIPKILKTVRIVCIPFNDRFTMLADEICVMPSSYGGAASLPNGLDESFEERTGDTLYTLSDIHINSVKAKYPKLDWPKDNAVGEIIERQFFLNFAGIEKAQLVKATYSYILPNIPVKIEKSSKKTTQDRVYNIFNLDDTDNILVEFKRIPRAIKGKDTIYDIYEPNDLGQLSKSIIPPPGGPIDCTFRAWKCIDPLTGAYVKTPLYYQWLNEMLFRGFYGSKDRIEHKGKMQAGSKDETYWIPYDYN